MRTCSFYLCKASSDQREIVLYLLKKETNRNQQRLEVLLSEENRIGFMMLEYLIRKLFFELAFLLTSYYEEISQTKD
jgi:hypothetical protein